MSHLRFETQRVQRFWGEESEQKSIVEEGTGRACEQIIQETRTHKTATKSHRVTTHEKFQRISIIETTVSHRSEFALESNMTMITITVTGRDDVCPSPFGS